MKAKWIFCLVSLLGVGATAPVPSSTITGDYVEARTASVFAGACHYNGELVTTGRDAVMAWKISSGRWNGVDLTNVKAMAAVSSEANLGDEKATRRCELIVDSSATAAQAKAFLGFVQSQSGDHMGTILSVRRGLVTFADERRVYSVKAGGFASLSVQPMPNDECCAQPSLVWYSPLVHLDHRKVGFTTSAAYLAGTAGDIWQQSGDNSAFYGSFTY